MPRYYKMYVAYDGTRYLGWQKLSDADAGRTIQGKLEAILTRMTGAPVEVHGSGRTDAGVHALAQVASFCTDYDAAPEEFRAYCNEYLPDDIAVTGLEEAPARFHARLHARGKTYRYRIRNAATPDVFHQRYEYRVAQPLDVDAMRRAAAYLVGEHDFRNFCASKRTKKSTVRTLYAAEIEARDETIALTFRGNGFLYHMVRIMTGTLIEAGLGRRAPESVLSLLDADTRQPAGYTAPARGLTLVCVDY